MNTKNWTALGLLVTSLGGCGGSTPSTAPGPQTVPGLRVETVRMEAIPDEIEAPGTVQSATTAAVASRVMGTVTQVAVREGDAVKRGQLLLSLDERELAARRNAALANVDDATAAREEAVRSLASAEAQAAVAAKTYERFQLLRKEKSVSPQEFDEVEAKFQSAQAMQEAAEARRRQMDAAQARAREEMRAAQAMAGYAHIVAPFDGVVVRRNVEPGAMAVPGVSLVVLEDASRYRLEVTVDAGGASHVRRGSKARVQLDALAGKQWEGNVAELEGGADPSSHTVKVRIELPRDPGMRSGLFGRAWFPRGERRTVTVAREAVVERGQLRAVFLVGADQVARLRLVTLGAPIGNRVEVLSGLNAGERVVVNVQGRELDGKKLEGQP